MSQSLYAIADEIQSAILSAVDPETGEISDEAVAANLESLEIQFDTKCLAVAAYLKGLRGEAERTEAIGKAIKAQATEHMDRGEKLKRQADRLEKYLDEQMEILGKKPAPTLNFKRLHDERSEIVYVKSQVVEVSEGAQLPDEFLRFPAPVADKVALKKALKLRPNGELIVQGDKPGESKVLARIVHKQTIKVK